MTHDFHTTTLRTCDASVCGRMGMGVLFFVILMVATHKVKTFKELKLTPAIALGGLMIGMSLACYVTSTLLTTVANAVLFIYTGPVICVLAARIFRKEPMSGLQWICLLVVFIGMLFGEGLLGFGVGGQLVLASAVKSGDFAVIQARAKQFTDAIAAWNEKHS